MEFKEVIQNRFSCRQFGPAPVAPEKLNAILEGGRLAPTAKNQQPQHIYVLQSAEALALVDQATPCRYGAPAVLAVAYDRNNVFSYPGGRHDSGAEDATIVATHLILAAADEGVNSCWVNNYDPEALAAALGLPENEVIVMLMPLGYAAPGAGPIEKHFIRKPLAETVTYR